MKYFSFLLLVIFLASCQSGNTFHQKVEFPKNNWIKFNNQNYEIPVEADKTYTFKAILITDSSFKERKLEIGLYLEMPNEENRSTNYTLRILDNEFKPLGVKTNQGHKLTQILRQKIHITESGIMKAEIVLHSPKYDNYGIVSFEILLIED